VYHEIPSDNIKFNEAPHMKAAEIAKAAQEALLSGKFDYVRVNFANGDMVGHTGDLEATKRACEAVDEGVKVWLCLPYGETRWCWVAFFTYPLIQWMPLALVLTASIYVRYRL
jgi:2,3-bisphosphoglycerate-independent phosphoglycerate mutase